MPAWLLGPCARPFLIIKFKQFGETCLCLSYGFAALNMTCLSAAFPVRRRQPDQAQVSPRCATAILQEALAWLQPQSLQGLINFVMTAAAVDSISNTVSSTGQAALLALAAAFDIVRACTAIPDMVPTPDLPLLLYSTSLMQLPCVVLLLPQANRACIYHIVVSPVQGVSQVLQSK